MKRALGADLERLKAFAFRRAERCGPLIERFHQNRGRIDSHPSASLIWRLYDWLCTPFSLWPVDFEGFAKHLLGLFEKTAQIEDDALFLLGIIGDPPDSEAQTAVAAFEHIVESGDYDHLVKTPAKFIKSEAEIIEDEGLAKAWTYIKAHWDTKSHVNSRGVIRRRLSQERNLRGDWNFDWQDTKKKFELFFDAMCYRWKLYGMQHDAPLLLKVSVNPTPHGTMIVIPRHWSLDPVRDLDWTEIRKLHRARVASRQGPKLSKTRVEMRQQALLVKKHWDEAGKSGIRGDRRYDYVHKQMKKDIRTDHSWVNRLLRIARKKKGNL